MNISHKHVHILMNIGHVTHMCSDFKVLIIICPNLKHHIPNSSLIIPLGNLCLKVFLESSLHLKKQSILRSITYLSLLYGFLPKDSSFEAMIEQKKRTITFSLFCSPVETTHAYHFSILMNISLPSRSR